MLSSILIKMKCWSSWIQMSAFSNKISTHFLALLRYKDDLLFHLTLSLSLSSLSLSCYLTNTLTKTHINCLSLSVPLVCNKDRSTSTHRLHSNHTIYHRLVYTLSHIFSKTSYEQTCGGSTCCVIWIFISIPPFKYFKNSWVTTGTWWILLKNEKKNKKMVKKLEKKEHKLRMR